MNKAGDLKQYLDSIGKTNSAGEYLKLIKEWAEKKDYPALSVVLEELEKYSAAKPIVVAIDGRSCAGKSTLAEMLSLVYQASIVHMDDFFLPQNLRTPQRYAQAGGNVHYERFIEEVLPHIRSGEAFKYRRFNCRIMDYGEEVLVNKANLMLVEGAYSLLPCFGEYYDLAIFMDIEPKEQLARLKHRNPLLLRDFQEKWIPLEEKYFETLKIREKCQLILKSL